MDDRLEIAYVVGDATTPSDRPAVIAHICNDLGRWGRGFVLAVSQRWPEPEQRYRDWYRDRDGNDFGLGAIQLVPVGEELWVANMIGQHGVRRAGGKAPIRYEALATALESLGVASLERDASVHMPRIGTGLAGGSWEAIEPIVTRTLIDRGVATTVYDLPA
ncbi:MAG: macro domain-containing protein [Acidimicrobiales bacterium]